MTMAVFISLSILVAVFLEGYLCSYQICIQSKSEMQQEGNCSNILLSIDDLVQIEQVNEMDIIFQGMSFNLTVLILFSDVSNLRLIGTHTRINCGDKSGLAFAQVQNLVIEDLFFEGCGTIHNSTTTVRNSSQVISTACFKTAVLIVNCTNVSIRRVGINASFGNGLVIFNTVGTVKITDSNFTENKVARSDTQDLLYSGGGGLYIEFSRCSPGILYSECAMPKILCSNSTYYIEECKFKSNEAQIINSSKNSYVRLTGKDFQGLGRGGGLVIYIRGSAINNRFNIHNCLFENNLAVSGGGLRINLRNFAQDNSLDIHNCTILNNRAHKGGGGVSIEYSHLSTLKQNRVSFSDCKIENNSANSGGGTNIILLNNVLYFHSIFNNTLDFTNCTWSGNNAKYGAAIDGVSFSQNSFISSPPSFKDCMFSCNQVINKVINIQFAKQRDHGTGSVKLSNLRVVFIDSVRFVENTGSALWAVSSTIEFRNGMDALFEGNIGNAGGALALIGDSKITVSDNSKFSFINNTAEYNGGAIYSYSLNARSHLLAASDCSIQYHEGPKTPSEEHQHNISFIFDGNTASSESKGHTIFMTSLHSCVFLCEVNTEAELTVENLFHCIGNATFNSEYCNDDNCEVSTPGKVFLLDNVTEETLHIIPGEKYNLNVKMNNDLNNSVDAVYEVSVNSSSSDISVDPTFTYISQESVVLYGKPGTNGTLILKEMGQKGLSLVFNITLSNCPPGYYLNNVDIKTKNKIQQQTTVQTCSCSLKDTAVSAYKNLDCKHDIISIINVLVPHGYWVGYIANYTIPQHLFTAQCPLHFCSYGSSEFRPYYKLPTKASFSDLDEFMCGPARTGVLCAKCTAGRSVFFHSPNYRCRPNRYCKIGMLLYVLSELVPLTLFFLMIMIFNISFTNGAVTGFIFFAQMIDSLAINQYGQVETRSKKSVQTITEIYQLFYRVFNLDFFGIDSLSFCIWEGATTLGILIFKYSTFAYALILMVITIVTLNRCNIRSKWWMKHVKRSTKNNYVIHGLSAFLVICYVQCAKISFQILILNRLEGLQKEGNNIRQQNTRVLYSGDRQYFSSKHLPYAIPAIIVILIVVIMPPMFLLWYPSGRKLLKKCGLSESKFIIFGEKVIQINKMKPLIDSFQSCYKDKYRFFAGVYFLYRIMILALYSMVTNISQYYIMIEILLVIMLCIHSIAQPYKERIHNILDTLLLSNMAVINALTIFIYIKGTDLDVNVQNLVQIVIVLQVILINLPLMYIALYGIVSIGKKFKRRRINVRSRSTVLFDDEFPARMILDDSLSCSGTQTEYIQYD